MERKYIVIIVVLSVSFVIGGFLLLRQGGASLFTAQLSGAFDRNQGWVQIKPRVPGEAKTDSVVEKSSGIQTDKNKKITSVPAKTTPQKQGKPVVKWCVLKNNELPLSGKVIINEVAWMGTLASYSDEWIELKNIFGESINLSGWQLQNKTRKIAISFSDGIIVSPSGLLLLERTDDNSVASIKADLIYSGTLGNSNEALYLFDNNCQLQDSVISVTRWPAGDNATKKTMERKPDFLWQNSQKPGGTPRSENSQL